MNGLFALNREFVFRDIFFGMWHRWYAAGKARMQFEGPCEFVNETHTIRIVSPKLSNGRFG